MAPGENSRSQIAISPRWRRLALRAHRYGAQDYLVKSHCDTRLLARTVRHALERHRIKAELGETLETGSDPGAFWAKWIDVVVERAPPETDGAPGR